MHKSACELATMYKEKSCPMMHLETKDGLINIYSVSSSHLLVFQSDIQQDFMRNDAKLREVLEKLIRNLNANGK